MPRDDEVRLTEAPGPGIFDSLLPMLEKRSEPFESSQDPDWASRQVAIPPSLEGYPTPEWTYSQHHGGTGNPLVMSYHTEQMRWIKVTAFLALSGASAADSSVDIPLLDPNGISLADPAIPPALTLRRCVASSTSNDYVMNPESTSAAWSDLRCTLRLPAPEVITGLFCSAMLIPSRDPYPHWVLRLSAQFRPDGMNYAGVNLMCEVQTNGAGPHDTTPIESGSSGVDGHYRVKLIYTQQAFLSTPVLATYNERAYGTGIKHVPANTAAATWLTSPNAGITDTPCFSGAAVPIVRVLGMLPLNATPDEDADYTWNAYALAMGSKGTTYPLTIPFNTNVANGAYYTTLSWIAGGFNVWQLIIANATQGPGGVTDRWYCFGAMGVRA